jgi:hypothetical protein
MRSSSWSRGDRRTPPYAFTEQGVAMLSSVPKSLRAVQVNIEIMRAFVRLREMLHANADLAPKLGALERRYDARSAEATDRVPQGGPVIRLAMFALAAALGCAGPVRVEHIDGPDTLEHPLRSGPRSSTVRDGELDLRFSGTTVPRVDREAGAARAYATATFTQWIGGSDSKRHSHSSPPSRPIQSWPVVVPK